METDADTNTAVFYQGVANAVVENLKLQHQWSLIKSQESPHSGRPYITGKPRKALYIHPDEQIRAIAVAKKTGEPVRDKEPEVEWVVPLHINEKLSLKALAELMDDIKPATKRLVLATLHHDSTIVYYIAHDGIVKPRQN